MACIHYRHAGTHTLHTCRHTYMQSYMHAYIHPSIHTYMMCLSHAGGRVPIGMSIQCVMPCMKLFCDRRPDTLSLLAEQVLGFETKVSLGRAFVITMRPPRAAYAAAEFHRNTVRLSRCMVKQCRATWNLQHRTTHSKLWPCSKSGGCRPSAHHQTQPTAQVKGEQAPATTATLLHGTSGSVAAHAFASIWSLASTTHLPPPQWVASCFKADKEPGT